MLRVCALTGVAVSDRADWPCSVAESASPPSPSAGLNPGGRALWGCERSPRGGCQPASVRAVTCSPQQARPFCRRYCRWYDVSTSSMGAPPVVVVTDLTWPTLAANQASTLPTVLSGIDLPWKFIVRFSVMTSWTLKALVNVPPGTVIGS